MLRELQSNWKANEEVLCLTTNNKKYMNEHQRMLVARSLALSLHTFACILTFLTALKDSNENHTLRVCRQIWVSLLIQFYFTEVYAPRSSLITYKTNVFWVPDSPQEQWLLRNISFYSASTSDKMVSLSQKLWGKAKRILTLSLQSATSIPVCVDWSS